jgi:putative ABC transport system permease protein
VRTLLDQLDQMPEALPELDEILEELEPVKEEIAQIPLPDVDLPEVDLSEKELPQYDWDDLEIPEVNLPQLDFSGVELPEVDLPEVELPGKNEIYLVLLKELRTLAAGQELSELDQKELTEELTEAVSPKVLELYDAYFEQQFDSIYRTLFDLQFEDALKEQYGDQFDEEFEKTFTADYQAQFEAEFEKTFNEQYLDTFNEEFDSTFDSQYAPLVEYQFEKTFEKDYQAQFDEEFEKTFEEEYLDTFNEEFDKTFAADYQDEFDRQFEETFENDYLAQFEAAFDEEFDKTFSETVDEELEELTLPTWYVFGRGDSVATYIEYKQDADAIGKIGNVFPVMFFLVAALVALTTMTRMVEDERSQIGTLKALGYSGWAIAGKYVLYTLFAAVGGSILGSAFGEMVFPFVIMNAYGILFSDIPGYYQPFQWGIAVSAGLAAVGCILFATLAACIKSTADKPAALMRPPAPKAGKRILLEHITILWRHLNFTTKASMRNLFRYKKRLFMTVFGIGGCMALLLVGFGLRDSILTIAKYQYRQIFTYDVSISISADADPADYETFLKDLEDYEGVTAFEELHLETIDASFGDNTKNLNLYVPKETSGMADYIRLKDRTTHEAYTFPTEGIAISEKSAKKLGASVGDVITLENGDGQTAQVTISCIFENYVNHYILMSLETYEELFGSTPSFNLIFTKDDTRDEAFEDELSVFLMDHPAVSGVTLISALDESLDNMLGSLDVVVWVLIISAALLAFVVLYNLNNINISERRRELATIKVLGFYHGEVAAYVYRDNIWLTLLGCVAGVFMGKALHMFVITTVEVEIMMFGRSISIGSYVYSVLFTMFFSVCVNFMMYFQMKKINMVESLKSVE